MAATTTSGFLAWFNEWGQFVMYTAQVLYWAALGAAAIIAALQFKRLVTFKVGDSAPAKTAAEDVPADEPAEFAA